MYTDLKIDVVVAKIEGLSNQLLSEIGAIRSEMVSHRQFYAALAGAVLTIIGTILAVLVGMIQFGGDSFQGGFGAASTFNESIQENRSELAAINKKLDRLENVSQGAPATPSLGRANP